ncbi:GntR family transcriptional regulator [Alcaligenaceae bacterium]|nr:GntR family transcriptional regulator [Alcaligenaceae bacterium]
MIQKSAVKKQFTKKALTKGATTGPLVSVEPKAKLTDIAYQKLEEAIVTLQLAPGVAISEATLSDMTGIGRTPIREAIQRLAREHLVQVLPQRGLLVAPIDVRKQLKLLETRREVERLVCRSAARRATDEERNHFNQLGKEFIVAAKTKDEALFVRLDREFNELCLVAARNEFAESAMRSMHGLSRRFWFVHYKEAADLPEMARLHAKVAAAIGTGDIEGAGNALDALLDNIENFAKATVLSDF